jgi:CRISPR system Cascade subunit CasE
MAFPSKHRKAVDPDFVQSYVPHDFAAEQVHVKRGANVGFLYRIDPHSGGSVVILIQSALMPNWDFAFHNAETLLAARPEATPFNPAFNVSQILRFRLTANSTKTLVTRNASDGSRRNGRRVPVGYDLLGDWLTRRAECAGFAVEDGTLTVQPGFVYVKRPRDDKGQRLFSVRYEGQLRVVDPDGFRRTLFAGIGPAKAFGFGLLSVARVRTVQGTP